MLCDENANLSNEQGQIPLKRERREQKAGEGGNFHSQNNQVWVLFNQQFKDLVWDVWDLCVCVRVCVRVDAVCTLYSRKWGIIFIWQDLVFLN